MWGGCISNFAYLLFLLFKGGILNFVEASAGAAWTVRACTVRDCGGRGLRGSAHKGGHLRNGRCEQLLLREYHLHGSAEQLASLVQAADGAAVGPDTLLDRQVVRCVRVGGKGRERTLGAPLITLRRTRISYGSDARSTPAHLGRRAGPLADDGQWTTLEVAVAHPQF